MLVPKRALLVGGALVAVVVMYSSSVDAPNGSSPTSGTAKCRVSVTADVLNVRSAPDAKAEIVGKFKQGAETDADIVVQNGFRKLAANRWAATEYLKPLEGRTCG
ncbi:SH3 domain-containing protein [Actinokineospora sp.]|uniref:SH3 domain-containing protein n=1 Tax=Actinokineospora sp. TaxID=1872133 RepID=UPI00403767F4